MFSRTGWQITRWNGETLGLTIGLGLAGGTLEIGLSHGSRMHTLSCIGAGGAIGLGADITPPSGALGFQTPTRTDYGRLYKNDLVVEDELDFDLLRSSTLMVTGVELPILDEGGAGYVVLFSSGTATVATIVAGAGGMLSMLVAGATCRAIAFVGTAARGVPAAELAGYRYRIIGGS